MADESDETPPVLHRIPPLELESENEDFDWGCSQTHDAPILE